MQTLDSIERNALGLTIFIFFPFIWRSFLQFLKHKSGISSTYGKCNIKNEVQWAKEFLESFVTFDKSISWSKTQPKKLFSPTNRNFVEKNLLRQ